MSRSMGSCTVGRKGAKRKNKVYIYICMHHGTVSFCIGIAGLPERLADYSRTQRVQIHHIILKELGVKPVRVLGLGIEFQIKVYGVFTNQRS